MRSDFEQQQLIDSRVTRSLTHSFAHSRPEWFAFLRPSTIAITGLKDATLNCSSKEERREKRDERDKHDRDDRDEGGNGSVPEGRDGTEKGRPLGVNNEQLNCICTATGFALSRVCILIEIFSTISSVSN